MPDTLTLAYFAAKGGQGTTVIAASVALTHAKTGRRTLLIDAAEHHDTYAALGCPEPIEPNAVTEVVPNLDLVAIDPDASAEEFDTTGYEVAVIDFGQKRPTVGTATIVTRACYLALRRALAVTPPPDNAIVIAEPGRALDDTDVASVLGLPIVATIRTDQSVARTVDAGLLASRVPQAIERHGYELVHAPTAVTT
jgi:hypothetical protein